MDPTSKKKVGSLLEALDAVTNRFNLRELENEIVEILSPSKSETAKKKESLYEAPSAIKYDPGFSFVRHQQNFIPGLSIPQETVPQEAISQEKPPDRSGFGDGKFENRVLPGLGFGFKEKTVTDAFRGRGGNFSTPRRYERYKTHVKEEIPSSSSSFSDNRVPKPEPSPFAERKTSQSNDRDPRSGHKPEDTEGTRDRNLDESNRSFNPQRRESYSSEQQRYPDRGGTSSNNRGYENRGRGVGDRGGWHDNRGGRGFSSNRGYDNRGAGPSGSNRGQDNRGRPFNNYRGPNNRGQVNDHRGGRRSRRRGKMSLEEQERHAAEIDKKNAEVYKQMRIRMGLPVDDEAQNK